MKGLKPYLLVSTISLLPLVNIFINTDLIHTHDGLVHLPRIAAYLKALSDGQIPVRFVGDLNYGYGMPLFNFIYPLPYFISSILMLFGLSLVNAFKMTLSLSFVLAGIFMLAFTKTFFNDDKKALLVTIFYQFAPFRLVELLVRGSFGEVYTYAFLPLVLFGLVRLFRKQRFVNVLITSIGSALLVLSHNSVSLLFFGISILFIWFFANGRKKASLGFVSLLLGLMLSSFYWIPAIFEHQYTYGNLFMKNLYLEHFAPIQNFFIPNFFNSEQFQIGGVSVQIGLFHVIAVALALIKLRHNRSLVTFCTMLIALSLFFTQSISQIFWENISLLRQFQFPWRFLSIIVFATSMLSVSFLTVPTFKKGLWYVFLLVLVIVSTANFWRPQLGLDRINEEYYFNFPLNTTYYGETDVIWSGGPASSYPKERVEVIAGAGTISNFSKKSNFHTFTVTAQTDVSLVDNTQYFPGWRVYANGTSIPIQFQDPNWRGLITFSIPRGNYDVRVSFEETKLRFISDIISLSTLGVLVVLWVPKIRRIYEI